MGTWCQEGPATHVSLVFIACRSYETEHDFAGPPGNTQECGVWIEHTYPYMLPVAEFIHM